LGALELWEFAARLKVESRRGWRQISSIKRVESVADHSFGVAVLSLFEGARRGYNVERMLILALIHDLEEAITGDLTPADKNRLRSKKVRSLRKAARTQISTMIPIAQRVRYVRMWRDLETGRTREARLVKDLDKLEMLLQARRYARLGVPRRQLEKFYRSALSRITDEEIRKNAPPW
jgi:putative hydrolases of HD superfamily